ncbi:MAG: hypothetical protein ABIT71_00650 [Vicinamibacteraceae bacterium]
MNLDLRPLTVSEFLDRTFAIYRHRFLLFVGLMAPQAVLSLIVALIWGWTAASLRTPQDFQFERIVGLVIGVGVGAVAFTIVHWILYVLGVGATTAAVSDLYGRMTPDVGSAFSAAKRKLGSLLWLTFLMSVRVAGVMLACLAIPGVVLGLAGGVSLLDASNQPLIGGLAVVGVLLLVLGLTVGVGIALFMGLRYAVAIPAVVLEPIGGREAIRRSIGLMRGLFARAFLLMICAAFIAWAAAVVLQMPFMIAMVLVGPETRTGFWLNMAGTATGTAGQTITAPIVAIGVVVLYFDARVRHEALDLQVMTEALPPPPAPAGPGFNAIPPPVPH